MDLIEKMFNLTKELENSEEFKTYSWLTEHIPALRILSKNYELLDAHLLSYSNLKINEAFISFNVIHRVEQINYLEELSRLFYNYVASTQTLVDNQRKQYQKLFPDRKRFPEYQTRIDNDFKTNGLACFIKDLRNYFLHVKILPIEPVKKFDGITGDLTIGLFLKQKDLRLYKDWKSKTKEFINSHEKDIDFDITITSYHKLVIEFQQWYQDKTCAIFKKEIDYVSRIKRERSQAGLKFYFDKIRSLEMNDLESFESSAIRFLELDETRTFMNFKLVQQRQEYLLSRIQRIIDIPEEVLERINNFYPN